MTIEIRDLELETRQANLSWLMVRFAQAQRRKDLLGIMATMLDVLEAGLTPESYMLLLDEFDREAPQDDEFQAVFQAVIEGAAKAPLDESSPSSTKQRKASTESRTRSSKRVDLAPVFEG